nr:restriction endonuclease subunit S [Microbacterium caowuchunii]
MAADFRAEGVPLLRLSGLKRDGNLLSGCNYLDPEMVEQRWSHFRVRKGDVLLSTSASLGEVAVVDAPAVGAIPYTGLIGFRPKDGRVDPAFIPLMLREQSFKDQIEAMGVGSVMKHFGPTHLKLMTVTLPPRPEQQAVAEVLGALDDKIAANTALISLTAQNAAAIVGGGPCQDVPLADVALFHNRRRIPLSASQRDARPGNVPYYGANGRLATVDGALFDEPLVLLGEDGSVVRDDGSPFVHYIWGPAWVNNHAHVLTGAGLSTELLHVVLTRSKVDTLVTGAVQPKLSMGNAKRISVRIPDRSRLAVVDRQVCALFASRRAATEECRTLTETRDALLPQLMSGKLRVRDAERIAVDAGL